MKIIKYLINHKILKFIGLYLLLHSLIHSIENSRLDQIRKSKKIKIILNKNYEPFYIENSKEKFPGLEVELAKLYADYLEVELEIILLEKYQDMFNYILENKADIIFGGMSSSLIRSKQITFSNPYLISSPAGIIKKNLLPSGTEGIIVRSDNYNSLNDITNIKGLSIGVKEKTTNYEYLLKNFSNLSIKTFTNNNELVEALKKNEINCLVGDNYQIKSILQKYHFLIANYYSLLGTVSEEHISAGLPLDDVVFQNNVNFFIKEIIRLKIIENLKVKYFDSSEWVKN